LESPDIDSELIDVFGLEMRLGVEKSFEEEGMVAGIDLGRGFNVVVDVVRVVDGADGEKTIGGEWMSA
jgi:hypothetical protein